MSRRSHESIPLLRSQDQTAYQMNPGSQTMTSGAPGVAIDQLSPSPPPENKMKGKLMIEDVESELTNTKLALNKAANAHVQAVLVAERLDALLVTQATALRGVIKTMRALLASKHLSKEDRTSTAETYAALKDAFNKSAATRNTLRTNLAEYKDGERIFEHDKTLSSSP